MNSRQENDSLHGQSQDRTLCITAHLLPFIGFIIPFGNILGPLVLFLIKRADSPEVARYAKESLNFQISVTIYLVISIVLMLILIGFILMFVVGIGAIALMIIAAFKASNGEFYQYPFTIRLVQ